MSQKSVNRINKSLYWTLRLGMILSLCFGVIGSPAAHAQTDQTGRPGTSSAGSTVGELTRVSVDSSGVQGNSDSFTASISADGRYVAFESFATNLIPGDVNGSMDIFVHDRLTGLTERVSVGSSDPSITADGRYVTYASGLHVYVHDRQTGHTTLVSVDSSGVPGNGFSLDPSSSADGRYVAFQSLATNLVLGDTNSSADIFVHDLQTGDTTRVSVNSSSVEGNNDSFRPSISADGRNVAFDSFASNLAAGDLNLYMDTYVHDRQTGATTLVSVNSTGVGGNSSSSHPSISADGRYVAFESDATNLVSGDTNGKPDIFVHDLQTGETTRVSVNSSGGQGNGYCSYPSISGDGRDVAFQSSDTNLVAGDTNTFPDIFVHDRQTGVTRRVSLNSSGGQGNGSSTFPSISSNGLTVAFQSEANNLVSGDTNAKSDIFAVSYNRFMLAVNQTGAGSGKVTSSPAGIDCGSVCSSLIDENTVVLLNATAALGSSFTGWTGGGCSGTGACSVTIDEDKSVTTDFSLDDYTLTVTTEHGTVAWSPDKATYHYGDVVTLTASPIADYTFSSWSGDANSISNPFDLTIQGDTHLTANYIINIYTLTVIKSGSGIGSVTSSPAGINCGSNCSESYPAGSSITLAATAALGSSFTGWTGGGCSGAGACVVTLHANTTVTANFETYRLYLPLVLLTIDDGTRSSTR